MEHLYAKSEVHSVSNFKGDLSHMSIFSDNSVKTVYAFFEEIDMSMGGWGTSKQLVHLLHGLLSEEIKSQVADNVHSNAKMKAWLINKFASPDRIVSQVLDGLGNRIGSLSKAIARNAMHFR